MRTATPGIAVVHQPTRLEGLRRRWGTVGQAKFLLSRAREIEVLRRSGAPSRTRPPATVAHPAQGRARPTKPSAQVSQTTTNPAQVDFDEYQREDATYRDILTRIVHELQEEMPIRMVDRSFLPTFDFSGCEVVVVVGQDGLVANTAKYAGDRPLVAINPDPRRIDGVLLPFNAREARCAVRRVLQGAFTSRSITLAEIQLNDGQRMLAFNDFFIGAASHISARYVLEVGGASEPQSSSGVIVSTGAGSTGWLSSVFNMAGGVLRFLGQATPTPPVLNWEDRRLLWAVREPFVSRRSQANLVAGWLQEGEELVVESLMPDSGVIFSDGIENDFLSFQSGTIARIGVSPQRACLVTS